MLPLSLYIHVPWCIKKCPYCDFNSHAHDTSKSGALPEDAYIDALIADFKADAKWIQGRSIETIFIGGGTPSLLDAKAYQRLFTEIQKTAVFASDIEITLEANPGTIEHGRFQSYLDVGINRISLGVQSFHNDHLKKLGRIHSADNAMFAIDEIQEAGFKQFNIDLMHGLPNQTMSEALADVSTALSFQPPHLSWYQLTIEPNTVFYSKPPLLPTDDALFDIEEAGLALLETAGMNRYEISAYSKSGCESRHNLNYWQFGDYLGIGAGAHAKLTDLEAQTIHRFHKKRQPSAYLNAEGEFIAGERVLTQQELPFEFLMNALRLIDGVDLSLVRQRAFISPDVIQHNLLDKSGGRLKATPRGIRFLNELLEKFL